MCVVFLAMYFFRVVLRSLHSLKQLIMISVWDIFSQTLRKKVFLRVVQIGPIHYFVIYLYLSQNYLSLSKLNLLIFFSDFSNFLILQK